MSEQTEQVKQKADHPTDPKRYADGTLKKGHENLHTEGGGRRRTKYIVAFEGQCSPEQFASVVAIARLDAQGTRMVWQDGKPTGRTEQDPDSTAIGRNAARSWLSKTIGLAGIDDDDPNGGIAADAYREYDTLTNEQSRTIRERIAEENRELAAELARIQNSAEQPNDSIHGADGSAARNGGADATQ